MELVQERIQTQESITTKEAQEHNAQIKERYRRLQNEVADQFNTEYTPTMQASVAETAHTVYAPTMNFTSTVAQNPTVTEFVRKELDSALFSTEKFERFQATEEVALSNVSPTLVTDVAQNTASSTVAETSYSLTTFAKLAMAIFAVVVVAMLTLVGINSSLIAQKNMQIEMLQERKIELLEKSEELQRRIADAISEESIREYALSQGMVPRG